MKSTPPAHDPAHHACMQVISDPQEAGTEGPRLPRTYFGTTQVLAQPCLPQCQLRNHQSGTCNGGCAQVNVHMPALTTLVGEEDARAVFAAAAAAAPGRLYSKERKGQHDKMRARYYRDLGARPSGLPRAAA